MAHTNGSRPMPVILTAPELMALELPEPRWAVPTLLPEGLTVLVGRPKIGKSWVALGLALAVASGGPALGSIGVAAGDVLYLALEDSPKRLQQRLSAVLSDGRPPARLHLARTWPKGGVAEVAAWLDGHRRARLVIVDTLARFRPPTRGHDRGFDQDYADLEGLQQLAIRHQVAVLVLHHLRKLDASDWVDQVSGTLGLAAAADGLLGLFRARGESEAELKVTGRDLEERELGLRFDAHAGTWVLLGEAATTVAISAERRQILEALAERPLGPTALAQRLAKNVSTTKNLLRAMADDGLVVSAGGAYTLARACAHLGRVDPVDHGPSTDTTKAREITRSIRSIGSTPLHRKERGGDDNLLSLADHLADTDDPGYVEALHDEEGIEA
jgi:hypothetical protein